MTGCDRVPVITVNPNCTAAPEFVEPAPVDEPVKKESCTRARSKERPKIPEWEAEFCAQAGLEVNYFEFFRISNFQFQESDGVESGDLVIDENPPKPTNMLPDDVLSERDENAWTSATTESEQRAAEEVKHFAFLTLSG